MAPSLGAFWTGCWTRMTWRSRPSPGTSAGALNGAAFKAGMVNGGRDGARATP